jgi:hypothetical protein
MLKRTTTHLMAIAAMTIVALATWHSWLGWDRSVTGRPYELWQGLGLIVTLAVPVIWISSRDRAAAAVTGTAVGLLLAIAHAGAAYEGLFLPGFLVAAMLAIVIKD